MSAEVTLPGVGGVPRHAVEVVGGLAAAFIAFRWWRSRSASNNTTVPVDPANTAADQSATGYINPGGIAAADNSTSSNVITTDAAWTQKVISDLEALGWNGQTVATALALYLSGQGLTTDQELIVRAAWSVEGKPPEHPSLPILPVQSPPTAGGGSGGTPTPAAPKLYVADGKTSLNGLASARHTNPNTIIALTMPHQPADVTAYLKLGSYSRAFRAGTKWYTP